MAVMENSEYVQYIHHRLKESFPDLLLLESETENQPNDNFWALFSVNGVKISFVTDRSSFGGKIIIDNAFIPFWKLDDSLQNIWLVNTNDTDPIIDYLVENRDELFPCGKPE